MKDKQEQTNKTDVHTRHCCKNCGCKYGEDKTCPVVNKIKKQERKCGKQYTCPWDRE